jgi:hypothetical protein
MTVVVYNPELAATDPAASAPTGVHAATGGVAIMLRLEGAAELAAFVLIYHAIDGSWWLFGGLFLLPDLSMLGYFANRKLGAALYNAGHTYLAPAALALVGWSEGAQWLIGPAVIWAAHIGFDRVIGYGLKYGTAFGATHLGWRGKRLRHAGS